MSCTYNYNIHGKLVCNEYFTNAMNAMINGDVSKKPGDILYNFDNGNNGIFVWNGSLFTGNDSQYYIKKHPIVKY